jgi:hypothetical protein
MRGVPQSGLWSEEELASSGTGSERAKVASVAVAESPREPGSPDVDATLRYGAIPANLHLIF